jgi:DNA segregation ATPase FtsK/SpoIIIE, S-DNA-T family
MRTAKCEDQLFDDAVKVVIKERRGSTSLLKRAFSIDYGRAAKLIDAMTKAGILGPHNSARARRVLMTWDEWLSRREE